MDVTILGGARAARPYFSESVRMLCNKTTNDMFSHGAHVASFSEQGASLASRSDECGSLSVMNYDDRATTLVQSAPSLVNALPSDAIDMITANVRDALLPGKWQFSEHNESVADGRLETRSTRKNLWLREDGGV